MFYFVIFHSSISAGKDLDKKTLTTFLYGCVLYIIFHALLSTNDRPFFKTIQSYFWVILAIDIICMLYIYVKLIKPNPISQNTSFFGGIKEKITGMLDNIVDTSMYSNDIVFNEYPINIQPKHMSENPTRGILKKTVSINESINEINEITQHNINEQINTDDESQHVYSQVVPENNTETDEINQQLAQLTGSMMNFDNNNKTSVTSCSTANNPRIQNENDRERNMLSERATIYYPVPEKPKDTPKELQSTSVDEIRKKSTLITPDVVKVMDTKAVLNNRTDLTNEQLGAIKLNYNPDELISDVLNRPKFEKGYEPNGVASSRLTKDTLQSDSMSWAKKNDDAASVASDIGSMLDFDLSEFAQSI